MKIDRLIGILMMLINKKKVTAKELSEYFEVSVRTIQRDMDILNMAGIPLYADVGVKGGYQLHENYKLEKGFLNKDEAGILHTFLKELEGVTPYSEVSSLYNKFATIDKHDENNTKLVVQLFPAYNTSHFKEHLSILSEGRDKQQKVKMQYLDVRFDTTERILCPYTLILVNSHWYVYGYCDLREDFRMFKVSRVTECELLKDKFELQKMPEVLPWETTEEDDREAVDIVLEIDRNNQQILPDYIDPSQCKIAGDKIIVPLHFVPDEWFYSQLMWLGPNVRVLKPDFVRKELLEKLQETIDKNKL